VRLNELPPNLQKKVRAALAVSCPDLESDTRHAPFRAQETERCDSPCSIHLHSIRKRLADIDGLSAKAVIDGIVKAGILQDDSPRYLSKVSFSQEKGEPEETIITIEWE